MNSKTLKLLALATGLGTLTACPGDSATTDTDTDSSGTTETGTTNDPTNTTPSTATNTTPTTTPTTTETEPTDTATTQGPTTDPSTDSDTDTDTDTGETDGLCARLGGINDGIPALVNGFLGKVLVDDRINGYFLNSDIDGGSLGGCVIKQLGALAGCNGVVYDCKSMAESHAGLNISQQDFEDFVGDFVAAYDEHAASHPDLTPADKATIGDALGGLAPEIVEDASNDLTVYQRVGRKPAIAALIGFPGQADSFVDNVANDASINGFFGGSDFDRLNTCLTRQVSSIDGPIKYGQEVDAPPGIDPGVSLAAPCLNMKDSHAGMVDDMNAEITVDDFYALVGDLVAAMDSAGVPTQEQMILLSVLGPMCDDIVADPNTCPGNTQFELNEAVNIGIVIDLAGDKWDNKYNGTIASMACVDITVPESDLPFVGAMSLKLGMDHTYVGDLTIKIVSPDDQIFTPLSRPGPGPSLPDDGVAKGGDNSNLSKEYPLIFTDSAMVSGKDMGKDLNTNGIICKDENPQLDPCHFLPYPGLAPGVNFTDYKGANATGTWKVCVGDSELGDHGELDYVGLYMDRVKFPPK